MDQNYDGTYRQNGLCSTQITGVHGGYRLVGIREGVIHKVIPANDVNNRSKAYTEYDVRDLYTGVIYVAARCVVLFGNADSGIEITHRAASKNLRGGTLGITTPARDTDATRVIFGFIDGSKDRPIILGCVSHSNYGYTTDGEQFCMLFNDTQLRIDKNGSFTVTRLVNDQDTTVLSIDNKGNIDLIHKRGATLKIDDSGNVSVKSTSTGTVTVQEGTLGAARLNDMTTANAEFKAWLDSVVAALAVVSANVTLTAPKAAAAPLAPIPPVSSPPAGAITYISNASTKTKIG